MLPLIHLKNYVQTKQSLFFTIQIFSSEGEEHLVFKNKDGFANKRVYREWLTLQNINNLMVVLLGKVPSFFSVKALVNKDREGAGLTRFNLALRNNR